MFLDIGAGIIISILISSTFAIKLNSTLILIGILFTLLPDLDFIFYFLKERKVDKFSHEHRDLIHYPIFYFVIGGFLLYLIFPFYIFILFLACSLFHFLHDSVGTGWGIKWLYPFSGKNYKFFSNKDGKAAFSVIGWSKEELKNLAQEKGDDNWIKNVFFKPSFINIVEFLAFLISLIVLLLVLR